MECGGTLPLIGYDKSYAAASAGGRGRGIHGWHSHWRRSVPGRRSITGQPLSEPRENQLTRLRRHRLSEADPDRIISLGRVLNHGIKRQLRESAILVPVGWCNKTNEKRLDYTWSMATDKDFHWVPQSLCVGAFHLRQHVYDNQTQLLTMSNKIQIPRLEAAV